MAAATAIAILMIVNAVLTHDRNPFRGYFATQYDLSGFFCTDEMTAMSGCIVQKE